LPTILNSSSTITLHYPASIGKIGLLAASRLGGFLAKSQVL